MNCMTSDDYNDKSLPTSGGKANSTTVSTAGFLLENIARRGKTEYFISKVYGRRGGGN